MTHLSPHYKDENHEQGLNFWETADGYGSHPHLKEAIRQVGRDKVVVLTKSKAQTARQMQADVERFLVASWADCQARWRSPR